LIECVRTTSRPVSTRPSPRRRREGVRAGALGVDDEWQRRPADAEDVVCSAGSASATGPRAQRRSPSGHARLRTRPHRAVGDREGAGATPGGLTIRLKSEARTPRRRHDVPDIERRPDGAT